MVGEEGRQLRNGEAAAGARARLFVSLICERGPAALPQAGGKLSQSRPFSVTVTMQLSESFRVWHAPVVCHGPTVMEFHCRCRFRDAAVKRCF